LSVTVITNSVDLLQDDEGGKTFYTPKYVQVCVPVGMPRGQRKLQNVAYVRVGGPIFALFCQKRNILSESQKW
jgi:hypothetical protein